MCTMRDFDLKSHSLEFMFQNLYVFQHFISSDKGTPEYGVDFISYVKHLIKEGTVSERSAAHEGENDSYLLAERGQK